MARAKSTHRAEARRRYRAQLAAEGLAEDDAPDEGAEDVSATGKATAKAEAEPPARPGIAAAYRSSLRPIRFREDLAYLPTLILHTKAVWLPSLIVIASAAAMILFATSVAADGTPTIQGTVSSLMFQFFVYPPPVGAIFIAGFLAPRASYMAGFIVGVVGALALAVFGLVLLNQPAASAAQPVATASVGQLVQAGFVLSPLSGIVFGGAAGWYRRFLNLANPNRQAKSAAKSTGKSGKPPKDSGGRPILARRR